MYTVKFLISFSHVRRALMRSGCILSEAGFLNINFSDAISVANSERVMRDMKIGF